MKQARMGRSLRALLSLLAVGVVAVAFSASGGTSARAALSAGACTKGGSLIGKSHFTGVVSAIPVGVGCAHITDDAASGAPPLIWHGGPVMGTDSTGPVVVTRSEERRVGKGG